ncbi:hypothetical protein [Haloarchaeobius sp. DFWS5]|uniref:hypothetical protein n=1 Tax=Haloarchaeobius sp. DFWS5 TaxID=3446114 RepID=UPI003EBD09D2
MVAYTPGRVPASTGRSADQHAAAVRSASNTTGEASAPTARIATAQVAPAGGADR